MSVNRIKEVIYNYHLKFFLCHSYHFIQKHIQPCSQYNIYLEMPTGREIHLDPYTNFYRVMTLDKPCELLDILFKIDRDQINIDAKRLIEEKIKTKRLQNGF